MTGVAARLRRARRGGDAAGPGAPPPAPPPTYAEWVARFDTPDAAEQAEVAGAVGALADPPTVSVLMPVFDPPEPLLRAAVESVRSQWYPHWELCLVDDGSTQPWVAPLLADWARRDPRVRVDALGANRHIAAASNAALALGTGAFVAPVDHDDVLAPDALARAALALAARPGAALCYSDEDHLDEGGARCDPYFKPDYDPLLLLGQNYLAHLCLLRRDLVDAVGGFREGLEGSQDWDLVLRVAEKLAPEQVVHVPRVLYHWRAHPGSTAWSGGAKSYAVEAGRRAVAEHLGRAGLAASVRAVPPTGFTRVHWALPSPAPTVSVIVASVTGEPLRRAVDSVLQRTTYPSVDVTVVVCGAVDEEVDRYLSERRGLVRVVEVPADAGCLPGDGLPPSPPERAVMVAAGVDEAEGEVLCFLHDDTEVVTDRWLEELVGPLAVPGVGLVGGKLLAPDGSVRHFGYRVGPDGTVLQPYRGLHRLDPGSFGRAGLLQSVTAASGAALVVRRPAFASVGGYAPVAEGDDTAADVDLCRRLRAAGWRVAVTPHAELLHHECDPGGGRPVVMAGWGGAADPAGNPNAALDGSGAPAWPPRPG